MLGGRGAEERGLPERPSAAREVRKRLLPRRQRFASIAGPRVFVQISREGAIGIKHRLVLTGRITQHDQQAHSLLTKTDRSDRTTVTAVMVAQVEPVEAVARAKRASACPTVSSDKSCPQRGSCRRHSRGPRIQARARSRGAVSQYMRCTRGRPQAAMCRPSLPPSTEHSTKPSRQPAVKELYTGNSSPVVENSDGVLQYATLASNKSRNWWTFEPPCGFVFANQ